VTKIIDFQSSDKVPVIYVLMNIVVLLVC